MSVLAGCSTSPFPHAEPVAATVRREAVFPQPTESQSNQLARLDASLRGSVTKLDLAWVADMGAKDQSNLESVSGRFVDSRAMIMLVRRLSSSDLSERRDADEKLRKLTGETMAFDPASDATARQRGVKRAAKVFLEGLLVGAVTLKVLNRTLRLQNDTGMLGRWMHWRWGSRVRGGACGACPPVTSRQQRFRPLLHLKPFVADGR